MHELTGRLVVPQPSPRNVPTRQVILAWVILGLAFLAAPRESFAQARDVSPQSPSLECERVLASVQKLKSASTAMLAALRRQRSDKMREALGPDVGDAAMAIFWEQEQTLLKTLRELDGIGCSTKAAVPSVGMHR
jgi:hypothetical protein